MKKILVVMNTLRIGGVASAFRNFVQAISSDFEVTICIFDGKSFEKKDFPNCAFLYVPNTYQILGIPFLELMKESKQMALKKAFFVCISKIFGASFAHRLFFLNYKGKPKRFDLAISFYQDHSGRNFNVGCNDFVLQKICSLKKITFVHCDFENYGGNDFLNRRRYLKFDRIVSVSTSCENALLRCIPQIKKKSIVLYNLCPLQKILFLSEVKPKYFFDRSAINFLCVCRLSVEKGLFRIINNFSKIIVSFPNKKVHLYIIGNGPLLGDICKTIHFLKLEKNIFLLGEINNPYPYFIQSDFLLSASYHECAPMVFDESSILRLPIIATETLSADEMVLNKKIGFVFANNDKAFIEGIISVLKKKEQTNFCFEKNNLEIEKRKSLVIRALETW